MEKVLLGLAARSLACVSLGVRGHVSPPQLGLDKWFDANVRQTSNYSPNDECSATALPPSAVGSGMLRPPSSHLLRQTHNSRKSAPSSVSWWEKGELLHQNAKVLHHLLS